MSRTALISGAARGIGRACALELAGRGYTVAVHYNSSEADALETVSLIEQSGGRAKSFKADLTDEAQVLELARAVRAYFGCPDVLVNNAGISKIAQFQDVSASDWDLMMSSNLRSVYLLTRAFAQDMIDRKSGSVINISSMWGQVGASCEAAYSASKGGVISLTKALAKELGPSGIRVNCVAPGCIKTAMMAGFSDETLKELAEETPLGRIGTPEEAAKAVAFFASDDSSFITGQVLGVNGGMVI